MSIMSDLIDLAEQITALGIPAVLDPRDAEAPGAIVDLDRIGDDPVLCGMPSATATVWLIAPDNGRTESMSTLLDMYAKVSHLAQGATPAELQLPATSALPALRLNPIPIGD